MVIVLKPEYTNEEAKTIRAQLFADTKEEVTSNMTVVGLKEGYTLDVASSVTTPSGIGYLKSNGEWAFVNQSGGGDSGDDSGGGGSSMQYKVLATVNVTEDMTYQEALNELGRQICEQNVPANELYMSKLIRLSQSSEGVVSDDATCYSLVEYYKEENQEYCNVLSLSYVRSNGMYDRSIELTVEKFNIMYVDTPEGAEPIISGNDFISASVVGNNGSSANMYYNNTGDSPAYENFILSIITVSVDSSGESS